MRPPLGWVKLAGLGFVAFSITHCVVGIEDVEKASTGGAKGDASTDGPAGGGSPNGGGGTGAAQGGGTGGVIGGGGVPSGGTAGGGTGGAVGGTGGGGTSCAGQSTCVAAPNGWAGPFAIIKADHTEPGECPSAFTEESLYGSELTAPTPQCTCTCSAESVVCDSPQLGQNQKPTCDGAGCTALFNPGVNNCIVNPCSNFPYARPFTLGITGSCPPLAAKSIPPHSWGKLYRLCKPAGVTPCENGVCFPTTTSAPITAAPCITAPGDTACPAGYPTKALAYTSVSDTRACSACTCAAPTCGTISYHTAAGCDGLGYQYDIPHECMPMSPNASTPILSIKYTIEPACRPVGGEPTGAATPTGATTLCCQ